MRDGKVPQAWDNLMARHREAVQARLVMRDAAQPQDLRDEATRAYCAATDAMVEAMDRLAESRHRGLITLLLSQRARA